MYTYNARLVRVIDGDTYVLDIDLGFYVTTRQHVRLLGIDCPESGTADGASATAFAREWWAARSGSAIIDTGKLPAKSFDRWVARVEDLADQLRAAGHVKAVERLG